MPLTELQVKNAKPKDKPYKLSDGGGMFLLISLAGGKHWRLKYRFLDKEKLLAMGSYPEVSLSDARDRRHEARKLLANDIDPGAKKQADKQTALVQSQMTLEVVTNRWLEKKKKNLSKSYFSDIKARLEKDILTILGQKPINSITALQIIDVLQAVAARGANELARRLKQCLDEIYRYAVVHGLAVRNPVADFQTRDILESYEKGHHPCIEPSAIPVFLKAMKGPKARLYPLTRMAMELLMLTFVRTGELINARWDEIDWEKKQWLIPATRMKMKRDHIVPLSDQALAILEELKLISGHRELIFPGQVNPKNPMSNNTILQALANMGYKSKMSGHGFRALAMTTLMEELSYPYDVVDRQLAHAPKNKIAAAYDRAKYLPQRQKMMQDWADYLDKALLQTIKAKGTKSNV